MYFLLIIVSFVLFSMWCCLRVASMADNNINDRKKDNE